MPNVLLLGPPGVGKTHLARWIASQKGTTFTESLAPVAQHDAPAVGIWLLDECHRQTRPEPLFPIMESKYLTVIGATTRPDRLDPAFRSRFFLQVQLQPLDMGARRELLGHLLGEIPSDDLDILAQASAGNPRQAERLAATAKALKTFDANTILAAARVNADGLNDLHMNIMKALKKASRPLGIGTVALMVRADESSVADHEMLLLDLGLLELSRSGRALTKKGRDYAGHLA